jgi:hypothetical protein
MLAHGSLLIPAFDRRSKAFGPHMKLALHKRLPSPY